MFLESSQHLVRIIDRDLFFLKFIFQLKEKNAAVRSISILWWQFELLRRVICRWRRWDWRCPKVNHHLCKSVQVGGLGTRWLQSSSNAYIRHKLASDVSNLFDLLFIFSKYNVNLRTCKGVMASVLRSNYLQHPPELHQWWMMTFDPCWDGKQRSSCVRIVGA